MCVCAFCFFPQVTGKKIPYEICPRRFGDVPATCANHEKAERELGFKASRTLEDMCQ